MALLDPLLQGVIKDTGGKAKVDLTLTGQRRDASLNGEITVTDLHTTLDYTKCTYSAPKARVEVKNNRFYLRNAPIYDVHNNSGLMSMDLSLDHLSNIEYSLEAQFDDMRVLGTTKRDNDMFYGDIFASGNVRVSGDKAGVKMDIAATSSNNSKFFMPLTDKSNISSADFVTFAKPTAADTTNYLVRKKMMFERRQKQRTASGGGMDINMSLDVKENAEVQIVIDPTVNAVIKEQIGKANAEGLITSREGVTALVNEEVAEICSAYGLNVTVIIDNFDFTDAFTNAVEAKQVATQEKLRAQTEQERLTMEAQQKAERNRIEAQSAAEIARINAEADLEVQRISADAAEYAGQKEAAVNSAIAQSVTPELIEYQYALRWDGKLPTYMMGEGSTPIVNLPMMGEEE